jgi:hypothetical protein
LVATLRSEMFFCSIPSKCSTKIDHHAIEHLSLASFNPSVASIPVVT